MHHVFPWAMNFSSCLPFHKSIMHNYQSIDSCSFRLESYHAPLFQYIHILRVLNSLEKLTTGTHPLISTTPSLMRVCRPATHGTPRPALTTRAEHVRPPHDNSFTSVTDSTFKSWYGVPPAWGERARAGKVLDLEGLTTMHYLLLSGFCKGGCEPFHILRLEGDKFLCTRQ